MDVGSMTATQAAKLREVKGEMPDELVRLAKTLDRIEGANGRLATFFERMGRHLPNESKQDAASPQPSPSGYLGDLNNHVDRLHEQCNRMEILCEMAEGIG